ncbi:MAG: SDR family NAD(P)-dependent oxidoreductase, partial [Armatimonadetes bacterium]|nr:SDR family NAD(P)-dependent oxidoreductase [Armatimonadota bacterium]
MPQGRANDGHIRLRHLRPRVHSSQDGALRALAEPLGRSHRGHERRAPGPRGRQGRRVRGQDRHLPADRRPPADPAGGPQGSAARGRREARSSGHVDEGSRDRTDRALPSGVTRMCNRLSGRSAVITGASQGLGEALALRLAQEGGAVCLVDVNGPGAAAAAQRIVEQTGQPVISAQADVTQPTEVEAAVGQAVAAFGKLDIMVCNAAILISGATTEFDPDKWRKVIEVNLFGFFVSAQAALRVMERQGSGVIVQINSKSGKKGSAKNSAYAAGKFGGIG